MNTLKMSMLNHAAVEALCSATYLENYLDCLDALPDDLQRNISQMRELDVQYNDLLKDIEHYRNNYQRETDLGMKKRALLQIQRSLLKCQELGDEKLQVVSQIIENIENRSRQLEQDLENLDPAANRDMHVIPEPPEKEVKEPTPVATPAPPTITKAIKEVIEKQEKTGQKRQRRQRAHHDSMSKEDDKKGHKEEKEKPKKKKKRKTKKEKEGTQSPIDQPIDPDEPTYCLCDQVSYGEMIGCDNDNCPIEWFHFNCVFLTTKPKGKWYCPKCRGDKATVIRPDLK